jgi:uncharacterized repeat protein (TIGR02543 family)
MFSVLSIIINQVAMRGKKIKHVIFRGGAILKKYILGSIVILLSNSFIPVSFAVEQPTSESTIDADEAVTVEDTDPSIDLIDEPILEVIDQTVPEEALDLERQDEPVEIEDDFEETDEELSEDEPKIVKDEIESRVVDRTIVDQGRLEFGDWILYSDGQLYLDGVVTKEASQAWAQHALSIKSIIFSQADLRGSFSDFFKTYKNVETIDFGVATLDSVTSMASAFEGLKNLKKVSFKDVRHSTSLLTNMGKMFNNCRGLTELDVSGLNTSKATTMSNMFSYCRGLTELDLSGFETGEVTAMNEMFMVCSGLTELDVSGFDTSKVTAMNQMFVGCSGLTELDVSGFNTSKVTTMNEMFVACGGLTELDVSGFDTSKVTNMSDMFFYCRGLTELDVSGFDTSKVINMSDMFSYCRVLTELDVSRFDTSKVTNMSDMFSYCSGLTELDLSGFDTSKVTNMNSMFSYCSGLTELDLSGFDTSKVTDMDSMFSSCSGLIELDVSGFDTGEVTRMDRMFSYCSGLTELDVSGFDTSKVTDMDSMFSSCSGLIELDVSGFDTGKVTHMARMFSSCSGLTELDVSGFDTSKVTNMNSMFSYCRGLTELDVSRFDTSKVTNMSDMFSYCSGLTELDVSGFDTGEVTRMDRMFSYCSGLTELDVSGFDTSKVTNMSSMFYNCRVLTEISISKDFKFGASTYFPTLSVKSAWQEENNRQLFFSSDDMIAYHNDSNETNTYRKVTYVELTMDAKGGEFENGSEKITQIKVMDELWEEQIPTNENYQFDGWYLDEEYTREFDFSQPVTESLTIYAKWIENYTVTIPKKIDLNSDSDLLISGINNGDKSLNVTIKYEESQIDQSRMLKLTNQMDDSISANVQLEWENELSDEWTILTIPADSVPVSKDSEVTMIKPKDIQAGDYAGQIFFSVSYE